MTKVTLPVFGEIEFDPEDDVFLEGETQLNSRSVLLELEADDEKAVIDSVEVISKYINEIKQLDDRARVGMVADYNNDVNNSAVGLYYTHHLQEFSVEELQGIFGSNIGNPVKLDEFIKKMKLERVGIYPNDEESFAVFDYSIESEITDYLLVINFNRNEVISSIEMES